MLIPSDRHTPADLEVWGQLERCDRVLARSTDWRRKVDQSVEMLLSFVDRPCYASVSWGKDSTVMAHLIRLHAPHVPLVWVRVEDVENPDCPRVRDAFLARFPGPYEEIEAPMGVRRRTEVGFKMAAARFADRHITGIRAQESVVRRKYIGHLGPVTARTCAPIAYWQVREVFAYLALHDLPVHPAYAMSHGGLWDRDWLRVAGLGGIRGTGMGRRHWELEYYPNEMARIGKTEVLEG